MIVVILQILQWILRIILFLLLLVIFLIGVVLIIPIKYRADGEFLEKKPGIRGKVTWFFYLIHMKFFYEDKFHMQIKVFGIRIYDTDKEPKHEKASKRTEINQDAECDNSFVLDEDKRNLDKKKTEETNETSLVKNENSTLVNSGESMGSRKDELETWQQEMEAEAKEEAEFVQSKWKEQKESLNVKDALKKKDSSKSKQTFSDKIENIKAKLVDFIEKIKNLVIKIQEGKLKAEHYIELWNRKETQITFSRAKRKLGKMVKAIMPRQWNITGEVGFKDPATTGQAMGVLGAMYPIIGGKVCITPNFDEEVLLVQGYVKGKIRLGNLLYQIISLLLNRHCFKFIKLVLDELGGSKKSKKEN